MTSENSTVLVAIAGALGVIVTQAVNWLMNRRKSADGDKERLWDRIKELEKVSRDDRAEYAEKLGRLEGRIETLEKQLDHARDDAQQWREKYFRASSRVKMLIAELRGRPGTSIITEQAEQDQASDDS